MKNNRKINKLKGTAGLLTAIFLLTISFSSCDLDYDIADTASIEDATPPTAFFAATQNTGSDDAWKTYTFSNQSNSATKYSWEFTHSSGEIIISTEAEPEHTFPGEGDFTVSLTASDNLGVKSVHTETITVVEPIVPTVITPVISEWAFEDGTDEGGDTLGCVFIQSDGTPKTPKNDGTNCWRIIGATVHQTTSDGAYTIPFDNTSGKTQGAKYPATGAGNDRASYQALTVTPNAKYVVTFQYALKNDGDKVRVGILNGWMDDASELDTTGFIAEADGDVALGKNNFTEVTFEFEANATGEIAIWIDNVSTGDTYLDNISIVPAP